MTYITPLSQRVANERYKQRQAEKGLDRVEVWIPDNDIAREEIREKARLMRLEAELEIKNHAED